MCFVPGVLVAERVTLSFNYTSAISVLDIPLKKPYNPLCILWPPLRRLDSSSYNAKVSCLGRDSAS